MRRRAALMAPRRDESTDLPPATDEEIVARYLGGSSSLDVALDAGCTAECVRDLVLKAGHKMRKRGGRKPNRERSISDDELVRRYEAGESGVALADLCGCSTSMIPAG